MSRFMEPLGYKYQNDMYSFREVEGDRVNSSMDANLEGEWHSLGFDSLLRRRYCKLERTYLNNDLSDFVAIWIGLG